MKRLAALFLCLIMLLSQVPTAAAENTAAFAPVLPSPLTDGEKQMLMAALYEAEIQDVRDAILLGLISCQELTAYYLQRIQTYADPYNCIITVCDNAMEEAKKRDAELAAGTAEGDLFGVPIVIKDNIHYAGFYTTNGLEKQYSPISKRNARVVENLLKEGVIVLGKSNMSAFAESSSISWSYSGGQTKNAYDLTMAPGGSSGGSAVITSLNLAMAGLGTDTNSSLRMPAALNGCVAMRLTLGSLSNDGVIVVSTTRDTPGVITRTVADQALMLDGMTGNTAFFDNLNAKALEGARLGVVEELSGPTDKTQGRTEQTVDAEVMQAFQNAVEELRCCGAEVISISLPNIFTNYKAQMKAELAQVMAQHDLDGVIYPAYLHTPQHIDVDENGRYWSNEEQNFINNLYFLSPRTGGPEITVPIGNHSTGPGIGMQITGLAGTDQQILDLAYSYTLRCDHRTAPEGAPNEYAVTGSGGLRSLVQQASGIAPVYDAAADCNADGTVDAEDAVYLLRSALFGEQYPVSKGDFDADGKQTCGDARLLCWHIKDPQAVSADGADAFVPDVSARGKLHFSLQTDKQDVYRGDSFTLTVLADGGGICDAYGCLLDIDPGVYTILSVQMLDSHFSLLQSFDRQGLGVLYAVPGMPKGTLCSVTLQVRQDAPLGKTVIKGIHAAGLGGERLDASGSDTEIQINCRHLADARWESGGQVHFRPCIRCGQPLYASAHVPDGKATEFAPCTCTVCGSELVPVLGHSFPDVWYGDENCHYRLCACGERGNISPHTWSTEVEEGMRICTLCDMKKESALPYLWLLLGIGLTGAGIYLWRKKHKKQPVS